LCIYRYKAISSASQDTVTTTVSAYKLSSSQVARSTDTNKVSPMRTPSSEGNSALGNTTPESHDVTINQHKIRIGHLPPITEPLTTDTNL